MRNVTHSQLQERQAHELSKIWDEQPTVIRAFIENQPQYEQLCSEVAYILKMRFTAGRIEFSAVSSRAKTLRSFAEKITRKQYQNPFNEVTDFAGVRVVYLYRSDRSNIEHLIESEFEVIEKIDKVDEQGPDRFGYGALHYLTRLGRKSSGARYDDLKDLICEIQVRTVLQDAWAIIDHHLSYKQDSDVPNILKRKLNCLSGLFETADDQFDRLRTEAEEYRQVVRSKLRSQDEFLGQEMNLDTFAELVKARFPQMKLGSSNSHISQVLSTLLEYGYASLIAVDQLLNRTEKARVALATERQPPFAVSEISRAIALEHADYRDKSWDDDFRILFSKNVQLVSPGKAK
jgi:putative GTP pyrophosphokinase